MQCFALNHISGKNYNFSNSNVIFETHYHKNIEALPWGDVVAQIS